MCGRFFLATSAAEIARHFELDAVPELAPHYNIAPGQAVPVIRARREPAGAARAGQGIAPTPRPAAPVRRVLEWRRWGLVPPWAADPRIGSRLVNARAETAARLPAFRRALARRRALVPADGFYEWQHRGRSARPFAVRVGEGLFAMAALCEHWEGEGGALDTVAILTCEANEAVRPIHDRMPVVVPPAHYARWLDPDLEDAAALAPLLVPPPAGATRLWPVDRRVNDVREDDAGLLEPERDLFSLGSRP